MNSIFTICLILAFSMSCVLADLEYECTKGNSGSVDITINKGLNNLTSSDKMTVSGNKPCSVTNTSAEFQLKDCPADKQIQVLVITHGDDFIVRNKDIAAYTLQCHYENKVSYAFVSAGHISITDATPSPASVSIHNVKTLSTPTTPKFTMTLSKQTGIVIGEKVTVTISSQGNEVFSPEECVASSTNYNHTLWSSDCDDVDGELFTKSAWNNITKTTSSISHDFFAFRFTDSSDITLICKLKVCPFGLENKCSLSCQAGGNTAVTPVAGRRRRSITEEDSAVVETRFTVSDPESTFTDSSAVTSLPTSVIYVVLGLYTLFSRM